MATHTPGPWKAQRLESFSYAIHTDYVHDRGHDCNIVREVRCEANALLIAAAPELLDALETLFDITPFATNDKDAEIRVRVRAVIAKAKGGN